MKKVLHFIVLLISICLCSSCQKNDSTEKTPEPQPTHDLQEIYYHVHNNKLPPLDTTELTVTPPPGTRTPVERLSRAPQDLVRTSVNLSVDFSDWDKTVVAYREIVYCFVKQNDGKMMLYILYSRFESGMPIMLTLETSYETAEELLAEAKVWSGMVTSINIITFEDYIYPQMEVLHTKNNEGEQSTRGPICYGRIFYNEDAKEVERLCYSCDSMDDITPFKITFERFGVLE